jgi:TAG lipase/steryl ester hydrolase/phospholipase A2/LPA acyltransferase
VCDIHSASRQPSSASVACSPGRPVSISEFSLGYSILQQLRSGSLRADEAVDSVHDMFVSLRAGLAALAINVASDIDEAEAAEDTAKVAEVCRALTLDTPDVAGFGPADRARMLDECLTICGRPALLLSGGGVLGASHVGVIDMLYKAGLLPHVLAGSSAGALVAAVVCTRTSAELGTFLSDWPSGVLCELFETFFGAMSLRQRVQHLLSRGSLYPAADLRANLRRLYGDVTFRQAYDRSQRVLNVSVSATRWGEKPRILNFLSAPNCCVWSAVAASCAFPLLYEPGPLLAIDRNGRFVDLHVPVAAAPMPTIEPRRWRDGSVEADLPGDVLKSLWHTSVTITSQTNPYIIIYLKWLRLLLPAGLAAFLADEMRHWARQSKIVTTALQDVLGSRHLQFIWDMLALFGQDFQGDFTLLHDRLTVLQILSAATNPSRQDLGLLFLCGQRVTWAQLRGLRRALAPTQAIAEAASELRRQARAQPAQPTTAHARTMSGGVPLGESAFTRRHGQSVPTFNLMVEVDDDSVREDEPGVVATPRPCKSRRTGA